MNTVHNLVPALQLLTLFKCLIRNIKQVRDYIFIGMSA